MMHTEITMKKSCGCTLVFLFLSVFLSACGGGHCDESTRTYAATYNAALESASNLHSANESVDDYDEIIIRARGSLLKNKGPLLEIRIDGKSQSRFEVAAQSFENYKVPVARLKQSSIVEIVFVNDIISSNEDRNITIESISLNGFLKAPVDFGAVFDHGTGSFAFDGVNVIAAPPEILWNGALRFKVPGVAVRSNRHPVEDGFENMQLRCS